MRSSDKIFRNYANFLSENDSYFKDKNSALHLLTDGQMFNKFAESIIFDFNDKDKTHLMQVFEHERKTLLEESANITSSDTAAAFAVTFFPILADIYNEDILYKAIIHHYTNTPILTVPKMRLNAKVLNSNGTEKSLPFPRARYLIRAEPEELSLLPGIQNNIFQLSNSYPEKVNEKLSVINKRYFLLEELNISVIKDSSSYMVTCPLVLRPDSRGQTVKDFEFLDEDNDIITGKIVGNINWDSGKFYYNCTFQGKDDITYKVEDLKTFVMFSARTGDVGRVKISIQMSGWDINVDVKEDFEFELEAEMMQEFKDIYNIDLVKNISEAIRTQTILNRDHDISTLLRMCESELKTMNTYEKVDFQNVRDTKGLLSPGFLSSIYQTIVPRFSVVSRYMYVNYNVVPQYILTGVRTAAMLENLQEYAISLPTYKEGLSGFDNLHALNLQVNTFTKSVILTSPAIEADKAYLLYKPDVDDIHDDKNNVAKLSKEDKLRSTVLANIIYKPLYMIEEITNSVKRTFIRSRSTLELFRPEGVGLVEVTGLEDVLTMNSDLSRRII